MEFSTWDIARNLLLAARWTVLLSLVSFAGGGVAGLIVLLARIARYKAVRSLAAGYIAVFQGTPLLLQLFLVFFGIPLLGIHVSSWTAATVGLTLCASAFLADIWRSGVEAIPQGQWEAGRSLGLGYLAVLLKIIAPQAFRIAQAPTVSFLVQMIKSTSVASIIGFNEIVMTSNAINNATFEPFLVYGMGTVIYFILCFPLTRYSQMLEARGSRGVSRGAAA